MNISGKIWRYTRSRSHPHTLAKPLVMLSEAQRSRNICSCPPRAFPHNNAHFQAARLHLWRPRSRNTIVGIATAKALVMLSAAKRSRNICSCPSRAFQSPIPDHRCKYIPSIVAPINSWHRIKINPSTLQIINSEWRKINTGIAPGRNGPGHPKSLGEEYHPPVKNKYFCGNLPIITRFCETPPPARREIGSSFRRFHIPVDLFDALNRLRQADLAAAPHQGDRIDLPPLRQQRPNRFQITGTDSIRTILIGA